MKFIESNINIKILLYSVIEVLLFVFIILTIIKLLIN